MNVELIAVLNAGSSLPESLSVEALAGYAALGCFSGESSGELIKKAVESCSSGDYTSVEKDMARIFERTAGAGHGAVLDHSAFVFSISDVPRSVTTFLCQFPYASHLQQSLRRKAASQYNIPRDIVAVGAESTYKTLCDAAFSLYNEMTEAGIPKEDARFTLPFGTLTSIQTVVDARSLMHMEYMWKMGESPEAVVNVLGRMTALARRAAPNMMAARDESKNIHAWFPCTHLYAVKNSSMTGLVKKFSSKTVASSAKAPRSGKSPTSRNW
jgi:thymidylate synthase ThyX